MTSIQDYAVLSAYIYNDARGNVNKIEIPQNWMPLGSGISNNSSGFSANAFQNSNEIVIAFKGTDFLFGTNNGQTADDLLADIRLGTGFSSAQLTEAIQYYQTIKTQNPNANITFTGHSLGAGLASIMSVWFDRPATVFADAPFKATSYNLDLIKSIADSNWIDTDLKQTLYDLLVVNDIPNPLPGQPTQSVLLNQNEYNLRQSDITAYYVKGEVLNAVFHGVATIVGANNLINIGGGDQVSSVTLHSIVLHAALKLEEQLRINTVNLPNLIPAIFDTEFRATSLESNQEDFLNHLLNDQIKLGYTAENGLLHQFAIDTARISGGLALENNLLNKALIAAVIEDYYFMEGGFTKAFFDQVAGGIGFDLNDIATNDPLSDSYLINALKDITKTDYTALAIDNIRDYKWYVPTGMERLTARPDDSDVLMLGGVGNDYFESANGNDLLYGGNGHDRLIGNGGDDRLFGGTGNDTLNGSADADKLYGGTGNDTLRGGTGNDTLYGGAGNDTYVHYTGDGNDTIIDSDGTGAIKLNGSSTALNGGNRKSDTDNLWESADQQTLYSRASQGDSKYTLTIMLASGERLTVKDWQNGQLGITLDDDEPEAPPTPDTASTDHDYIYLATDAGMEALAGNDIRGASNDGEWGAAA